MMYYLSFKKSTGFDESRESAIGPNEYSFVGFTLKNNKICGSTSWKVEHEDGRTCAGKRLNIAYSVP